MKPKYGMITKMGRLKKKKKKKKKKLMYKSTNKFI